MIEWTEQKLLQNGYRIENAKIVSADLDLTGVLLALKLTLKGSGWGCTYGGAVLGSRFDDSYACSAVAAEWIMQIMELLDTCSLSDAKGKYLRVAFKGTGSTSVYIVGNIISDKWIDQLSFFNDYSSLQGKFEILAESAETDTEELKYTD